MNALKINPHNHDVPKAEAKMLNVHIDGKWVQVPEGTNVIEAAKLFKRIIPHYCYHSKLSVSGNCRMCLFEMGTPKLDAERKPVLDSEGKPQLNWMPRPQIGCATIVSEGMGIRTDSQLAKECQHGVMEFLLANHPLDCPICDQAGECKLQQYSVEYGNGTSRFVEEKVKKPKHVDLGERIMLDDERCILCSRCIRFAKEVMHDDVLGFVNRGSYSTLTAHEGKKFDNAYSLNTVDICPVGALTSKDFRFKMRVWFLKETKSICTSCGTGCNITIGSRQQTVYRLTPRTNEDVNSHWMCDHGRLNFHYLHDDKRLQEPLMLLKHKQTPVAWAQAFEEIGKQLKTFKADEIAIIGSASMTNEELYLLKKFADHLHIKHLDVVPRLGEGDNYLKSKDQNPNSNGAHLMNVSHDGKKLASKIKGIEKGEIKALLLFNEDAVDAGISQELLNKLSLIVSVGILPNQTTPHAHFVLPGSGFAEKRGSMVNTFGRLQKLNQAVQPPAQALNEWEILKKLILSVGGKCEANSVDEVFREITEKIEPFKGLNFGKIGDAGVQLKW